MQYKLCHTYHAIDLFVDYKKKTISKWDSKTYEIEKVVEYFSEEIRRLDVNKSVLCGHLTKILKQRQNENFIFSSLSSLGFRFVL